VDLLSHNGRGSDHHRRYRRRNHIEEGTLTGTEVADLDWHTFNLINDWENHNASLRPPAWRSTRTAWDRLRMSHS